MTLGELITKKREESGYGKMEFCGLMRISDDTLRNWERDIFVPAGRNRRLISRLLDFSDDEKIKYFGGAF
jgi:DNA-binding transcriptional regulator YiaG